MKNTTLHMIGNAHIDPVWLWRWPEGFQEVMATFRSALDRMKEDRDFQFTASSAAFYEWVELHDPAMFHEIRARVAEGRWELAGGWWVEPDCNIPCGEAFVRQALIAQSYFRAKFGKIAKTGYNIDSFGHNAMLPQILRKSGVENYVFMRPDPNEKQGLPGPLFQWQAPDGSRVAAFRIVGQYLSWGKDLEPIVTFCAKHLSAEIPSLMCFYGVGNHGGGPTRENIASIRRMDALPEMPRLVFSSPTRFFESLTPEQRESMPLVRDELQHHARGCYSAHSGIKRWNREAENLLLSAERLCAVAQQAEGLAYPADFERAWKSLLFCQFHDILAGSSIESACEDARDMLGEVKSIASRNLHSAVQSIAWNIQIPEAPETQPIVVFNPHPWAAPMPVEMQCGGFTNGQVLLDDEGRQVPMQPAAEQATPNRPVGFSFIADLPSLGYRTYRLAPKPPQAAASEAQPKADATEKGAELLLENQWLRLQFDPATGCIASLIDKRIGGQAFRGMGAEAVVLNDPSDTWSHGLERYGDTIGSFRAVRIRKIEHGPVRSIIRVHSAYGNSTLRQDFILYRDLPLLFVNAALCWHDQMKALKLRFPVNVSDPRAACDIPFGHIERAPHGQEEPCQQWIDMSGTHANAGLPFGMSVLNDSKYGYDADGSTIAITILRSPPYAWYDAVQLDGETDYRFMDQGEHRFRYALLPHGGDWRAAQTIRRAAELNQSPIALVETFHPAGSLPLRQSFLGAEPASIVVTAVKNAEDGNGIIVRAFESHGAATQSVITGLLLGGRSIEAHFSPHEIKTFRVPRNPRQPIAETNLLEWCEP